MLNSNILIAAFFSIVNALVVIGLAKYLGPIALGNYAIFLLFISITSTLLNGGLPSALLYFRSANNININNIKALLGKHLIITVLMAIIIVVSFVLLFATEHIFTLIGLLFFSIILQNTKTLLLAIFYSYRKFKLVNYLQFISIIIKVMIYYLLFKLNSGKLVLTDALLISCVEDCIFLFILINILVKKRSYNRKKEVRLLDCHVYGWRNGLANLMTILFYRLDVVILGYLVSNYAAGQYNFASQVIEKTWFLTNAITTVIIPKYTRSIKRGLISTVRRMIAYAILFNLAFCVLLAVSIRYILSNYLPGYMDSESMVLVLMPGVIFMSASKIYSNFNVSLGDNRSNVRVIFYTMPLLILFDFIFIDLTGSIGASIACSLVYTLHAVLTRKNFLNNAIA